MRNCLRIASDAMTKRHSTLKHPFGTIKAWMGTTLFLLRRLKKRRATMALNRLA